MVGCEQSGCAIPTRQFKKEKKTTTQQKLSRGVNDALFAVPSTPAVVL